VTADARRDRKLARGGYPSFGYQPNSSCAISLQQSSRCGAHSTSAEPDAYRRTSSLLSKTATRSRGACLRRWARLSSRPAAQKPHVNQGQHANCKAMPKAPRRPAAPMRRRPPRR
jgi:hypothetical protein